MACVTVPGLLHHASQCKGQIQVSFGVARKNEYNLYMAAGACVIEMNGKMNVFCLFFVWSRSYLDLCFLERRKFNMMDHEF